jgi:hypothetical protein
MAMAADNCEPKPSLMVSHCLNCSILGAGLPIKIFSLPLSLRLSASRPAISCFVEMAHVISTPDQIRIPIVHAIPTPGRVDWRDLKWPAALEIDRLLMCACTVGGETLFKDG